IRMHGLEPEKDIPIVFSGKRPGEKLFEELLTAEEGTEMTKYERIFSARVTVPDACTLDFHLRELEEITFHGNNALIVPKLMEIVPTFSPDANHLSVNGRLASPQVGRAVHS